MHESYDTRLTYKYYDSQSKNTSDGNTKDQTLIILTVLQVHEIHANAFHEHCPKVLYPQQSHMPVQRQYPHCHGWLDMRQSRLFFYRS